MCARRREKEAAERRAKSKGVSVAAVQDRFCDFITEHLAHNQGRYLELEILSSVVLQALACEVTFADTELSNTEFNRLFNGVYCGNRKAQKKLLVLALKYAFWVGVKSKKELQDVPPVLADVEGEKEKAAQRLPERG